MANISLPVIDALLHPPLGVLSRTAAVANPYSGPLVSIAPPSFGIFPAYGVVMKIHSVGAERGRSVGFPVIFNPPLGVMSLHYTDLSGFDIVQQVTDWTFEAQPMLWIEPLPALFVVYLSPTVVLDLFWLHT